MQKAVLHYVESDVSDTASYDLDNPDSFSIEVTFTVGHEGAAWDELERFRLQVCSPGFLTASCLDGSSLSGRGLLIMNEYREKEVRAFVERIIRISQRETWDETIAALMRYAYWAEE